MQGNNCTDLLFFLQGCPASTPPQVQATRLCQPGLLISDLICQIKSEIQNQKSYIKKASPRSFLLLGACKKENGRETVDPLVGNWKLRVVSYGGQSMEVTDRECFKDSYVNVDTRTYILHLSLPDDGQCRSRTVSAELLTREAGTMLSATERKRMPAVQLLDNNETLQMTIDSDNGPYIFSFRK